MQVKMVFFDVLIEITEIVFFFGNYRNNVEDKLV